MTSETIVYQPALIDSRGNINIHGQGGMSLAFQGWNGDPASPGSSQIDISGNSITFEIYGVGEWALEPNPNDALGLLLTIPSLANAGIFVTPGNYPSYAVVDTTGSIPVVRAEGLVIVRGWEAGQPGYIATRGGRGYDSSLGPIISSQADDMVFVLSYIGSPGPPGAPGSQSTDPYVIASSPYTLVPSDVAQVLTWTGSGELQVLVPDGLGVGFNTKVALIGSGSVTFAQSGEASIYGAGGLTLTTQYAIAELVPFATDQYILNLGGSGGGGGSSDGQLDFSVPDNSGLIGH
jgi:hypothetical protein